MGVLNVLSVKLIIFSVAHLTLGQRGSSPKLGAWGQYGPCSVTCGIGIRERYRSCLGRRCGRKLKSTTTCMLSDCEEEYSVWSDFDECSVTCGGGIQSRTRKCLVDICKQNLEEIRNCRTRNCPAKEDCSDSATICRTNSNLWCGVQSLHTLCRRSCGLCKAGDAERPQPWTEYGPCSVTCGFGLKTRSNGKESQSITCALAACKEDKPRWSSWGTEEPCSVTCGGGFAIRRRKCSVPGACNGVAEQRNRCQIQPCEDYTKWSKFGQCSKKCGGGVHTRTRACLKFQCTGHLEEIQNCHMKECKTTKCADSNAGCQRVSQRHCQSSRGIRRSCRKTCGLCEVQETTTWTEYGPCSVTCGVGLMTRTKDSERQSITCSVTDCEGDEAPKWNPWEIKTPCPVTCGGGVEIRSRTCSKADACVGDAEDFIPCNTHECQEYSVWSGFNKCSVKCGGGIQSRTRTCLVETCSEHLEEIRNCKTTICKKNKCEDKSTFCKSFKTGCSNKSIRRNCQKTCGFCKEASTWSEYGPCSVTCGAGLMTRNKESVSQSITCVLDKCPEDTAPKWNSWIEDAPCTVTCGGGTLTRARTCSVPEGCSGVAEETIDCATQTCPDWLDWSEWSDCTTTCGPGTMTRNRECSISGQCEGDETQTEECTEGICETPEWNDWLDWTVCSMTCGPGTKSRVRTCSIQGECEGKDREDAECNEQECPVAQWRDWMEWSDCSETCGQGTMSRERTCSIPGECDGERTEIEECYEEECQVAEWNEWLDWAECSETCGPGTTLRERTCTIPGKCEGDETEVGECNEGNCATPEWSEWRTTPCDVTCGEGSLRRTRECSEPGQCPGEDEERISCKEQDCPKWGKWSEWGPCSTTCGPGESARSRTCNVPNECVGNSDEKQDCLSKQCEEASWSTCSKTCGGGTRRKYFCNGTECEWQFEGCADGTCPDAPCQLFGPLFKNRYNSSHQCCNINHIPTGEQCGRQIPKKVTLSDGSQKRVIGGIDAVEDQWPWMVAVHMAGTGFCAGSLISKKFILSAAHCFAFDSGKPMDFSDWKIFAGILKLAEFRLDLGLKIKETYIHPDYVYPVADIALVELENEVTFTPSIQPICLPHGEVTPEEATCIVTGWGVSTVPDTVTNHLQELPISNFDPKVCVHAYGKYAALQSNVPFLKKNKGYICAGSLTKEIDSCSGDSGGPLICQRCDSCSWYITGVVSFGPNPCALVGVPGIYSKVVYYEDWIFSITKMKRHSLSCSSP